MPKDPFDIELMIASPGLILPRTTRATIILFNRPPDQNIQPGEVFVSEDDATALLLLKPHVLRRLRLRDQGPPHVVLRDKKGADVIAYRLVQLVNWLLLNKHVIDTDDILPYSVWTGYKGRVATKKKRSNVLRLVDSDKSE